MKLIFSILVLLLLASGNANAATYYVTKAGSGTTCSLASPCLTVSTGLSKLSGGDTLLIGAGTYAESINNVESGSNIPSGSIGAPTTIQASGGTVTLQPSGVNHVIEVSNRSYVVFDGIHVDGVNTNPVTNPSSVGVKFSSATHHSSFINGEIKNVGQGFQNADTGSDYNTVRNNDIHGIQSGSPCGHGEGSNNGVYSGQAFITVDRNRFYDIAGYGIQIYHYNDVSGENHDDTISNNIVHDTGLDWGACGNPWGGMVISGPNHKVFNNIVYHIYGDGISAYSFGNQSGTTFYNNTVYNSQNAGGYGSGIQLNQSVTARNNISSNNAISQIYLGPSPSGVTADHNLCSSACGVGSSNVVDTAANTFVNAGLADFHLGPNAFARNQGVNLGSPYNTDFANVPRPAPTAPWDIGAYQYGVVIPPPVNQPQLVLGLPLNDGSGSTAVDVSGQKNNATRVGGATWDNSAQAIALDGTGYLSVPAVQSLALAPAMTLEAQVFPTIDPSDFATVIHQGNYWLFGSTKAGYCPTPIVPMGGYLGAGPNSLCATSGPPVNQWSHLAVTNDGVTTTFYINGHIVTNQPSLEPMVSASNQLLIGASPVGEYFTGKIKEVRVYNYSRTPAQILSDANTPLIGVPVKSLDIAAPQSVEISSGSSLEISAD